MAKAVTIKVKLVSSADTGFYYVAKKNSRTMTEKLVKKKYDPVARKHVEFREGGALSVKRSLLSRRCRVNSGRFHEYARALTRPSARPAVRRWAGSARMQPG